MNDEVLKTVITSGVSVVVAYIAYILSQRVKNKDRIELIFERYDRDFAELRNEIEGLKSEVAKANQASVDKDVQIRDLQDQLDGEKRRYSKLEQRFNEFKRRYEKGE